ncbi:MAG TPA: hypothetical protein VLT37_05580 [Acidocella sp.]|nr:hypothetical protein [Acidocella sp.]
MGQIVRATALAALCFTFMTAATAWAQSTPSTTTDSGTGTTPTQNTNPNGAPAAPKPPQPPTAATCLKASPFNGDSAFTINQKIQEAGYTNVRGLYLGCDALWRAHAFKNGIDSSIMVTPTGRVIKQGY